MDTLFSDKITTTIARKLVALFAAVVLAFAFAPSALASETDPNPENPPATSEASEGWTKVSGCEWQVADGVLSIRPLGNGSSGVLDLPAQVLGDDGDTQLLVPWERESYTKVVITEGIVGGKNLSYLFYYGDDLTEIEGLEKLDTSNTEDMTGMFFGCTQLASLNLSNFDTRKVTNENARRMFVSTSELKTISIGVNYTLQSSFPDGTWVNEKGEKFAPETIPQNTAGTYTRVSDFTPDINPDDNPGDVSGENSGTNTVASSPATAPIVTGTWKTAVGGQRWFQLDKKSQETIGAKNDYPANAWVIIDGKTYHFDVSGHMDTGWQKIDDLWYYFGSSSDGAMKTGWQKVAGSWYFMDSDGKMLTGWVTDKGKSYFCNSLGVMQTGWKKIDDHWYLLGSDGAARTGWQRSEGSWYYLGDYGVMQAKCFVDDKNERYYLKSSGALATGWQKIDDKWYLFGSDGAMATGWQKSGASWYFLNDDGAMATGWHTEKTKTYYLKSSGAMATGWQKIDGKWYFFSSYDGTMVTGWQRSAGLWYFLANDGVMQTGMITDKGDTYYLKASGAMATGWQKVGEDWYYLNSGGVMQKSKWISNKYWVGDDGVMATNAWVDGDKYYVDGNGAWVPNAKK